MLKTCRFGSFVSSHIIAFAFCPVKCSRSLQLLIIGATCAAGLLAGSSELAMANSLSNYASTVSSKTNVITDIITYFCYIGGAILSALGIVDLKNHVQQPTQVKLKDGLAKLGFGGLLLAIPFVSGIMQETMAGGGTPANFQQWSSKPVIGGG